MSLGHLDRQGEREQTTPFLTLPTYLLTLGTLPWIKSPHRGRQLGHGIREPNDDNNDRALRVCP